MTTFRIEAFWQLAERVGFRPLVVVLQPEQPLVHDERYAYFLLEAPRRSGTGVVPTELRSAVLPTSLGGSRDGQ
jgi:hypothetical protein